MSPPEDVLRPIGGRDFGNPGRQKPTLAVIIPTTMSKQTCPLCGRRKARRSCPAKGALICSICCGTKRLTEIACPPDCSWLQSASAHPPAVVQRQRERDVHLLVALLHGLPPQQQALTYRLLAVLGQDRPDLPGLRDADIAEAAQAMAQTAETASRGIVYQHAVQTTYAQRLVKEMTGLVEAATQQGAPVPDHDLAEIFRRIERSAREGQALLGAEGDETACVAILKRFASTMTDDGEAAGSGTGNTAERTSPSGLIVPGR